MGPVPLQIIQQILAKIYSFCDHLSFLGSLAVFNGRYLKKNGNYLNFQKKILEWPKPGFGVDLTRKSISAILIFQKSVNPVDTFLTQIEV